MGRISMGNWATDLYNVGMKEKTIPLFINEIKAYTGFNGDFNKEYKPWYLMWGGPRVESYNIDKPENLRSKIIMPEPKSSTGSTFDVFIYLFRLGGELLHDIDYRSISPHDFHKLLPQKHSLQNDIIIHLRALDLTEKFMKKYFHKFYIEHYRYFKILKKILHHTRVD